MPARGADLLYMIKAEHRNKIDYVDVTAKVIVHYFRNRYA